MKKLLLVATLAGSLVFGQDDKKPEIESKDRSTEKRATVIGTAAAAGAAIGAAVSKDNRAKGAIIGAAIGGVAGVIFDQVAKKKGESQPDDTKKLTEFIGQLAEAQ